MANEFTVHRLNAQGLVAAEKLAHIFDEALEGIRVLVPNGRELALVITKMQEASFFAKRGIAVDPANQE